MADERTYDQIVREYEQARVDYLQGFRRSLGERGVTITSADHYRAEEVNYAIAHQDEAEVLEALAVEVGALRASMEQRVLDATELAAKAHDDNARWARLSNDTLKATRGE